MPSHRISRARLMRGIFKANMLFGVIAFAVAVYFTVTGHYHNLAAREAAEAVLNRIAIGGLLYVALFWFADVFSRPFLSVSDNGRT